MVFEDYMKFVMVYKNNCVGFPLEKETLFIHFQDCSLKIKDIEVFKRCFYKFREFSQYWPSHIDLIKLSLPELPPIDAEDVLRRRGAYHEAIHNYLCDYYGLSLPGGQEITNSLRTSYDKWLNSIRYYLPKFIEDYKDLKTDNTQIFNEKVIKELGFNQKLLGE